MAAETAIRAIWAIDCLSELMDLYDEYDEEEPQMKKRKIYVKSEDIESQLLKDIAWKSTDGEDTFCPLTMDNFEDLYTKFSRKLDRNALVMPSLSIRLRLAITLRYLIAGESHRILESISHVSRKNTTKIIPEMLKHLIDILEKEYLKLPKTQSEWLNEAKDFETFWEFPHTLGVLDARNFRVKSSTETSTKSLVLLSVLDAHSRFQHIEIIQCDKKNYSSVYKNSRLYKSLTTKTLNIPSEKPLKGQTYKTPYFFAASDVFGLDRFTLNAYNQVSTITRSQRAFNFRLNRVRLPVQMAFEIIYFRFKIFYRLNDIHIDNAYLVVKSCCLLHNYLTQKLTQRLEYNEDLIKLELPGSDIPLPKQVNLSNKIDNETRENICNYFVNEGNIPEQWQKII